MWRVDVREVVEEFKRLHSPAADAGQPLDHEFAVDRGEERRPTTSKDDLLCAPADDGINERIDGRTQRGHNLAPLRGLLAHLLDEQIRVGAADLLGLAG